MIDKVELRKWWDIFVGDGNFTEVRILGKFQYSGYFKSFDNLCKQLEPYTEMDDEQIYFVLNRIDESCYARPQCEKFVKSVKVSTNDNDIISRCFVMIDCDPVRKSSVNSSEFEFNCAMQKARDIFRFLRDNGFEDAIVCHSGNGAHLQLAVDLPNDEETTNILKRFYQYLGQKFTDENVDIDQKVFNLGRLCKTYSTVAKKGANLPDRPWRQSKILYVPKELKKTSIEKFKAIADLLPKEEPKQISKSTWNKYDNSERFDLENWLKSYGIEYRKKTEGNSTKYEIKDCPWKDQHSSNNPYSSALFQDEEGKITYTCAHAHCKDKQWRDFRLYYQPDAYNKPQYESRPQRQYIIPQKPKYEIKDELPELGKKWLCMSDIKKVDLSAIPRYKTGIMQMDRLMLGLAEGEVTLMSGGNASGKSSFINTLVCNFLQQGAKVALWSGEFEPPILKAWVQMVAAGKNNLRPSTYGDGKYYVPNNIGERIDKWMDGKFFIFNNKYGSVWKEVFHDMTLLLSVGVKMFILDNLMSLDIDLLDGDKNGKQKELILQIKDFAKKNNVHVILVAHPRKSMAFLRKNDISGTSDLTNVVDNVLICHRVNQDFFKAGAEFYGQGYIQQFQGFGNVVEISKNRMYGIVDVLVGMQYEIESRRFKNDENENIQYGWEQEPIEGTIGLDYGGGGQQYRQGQDSGLQAKEMANTGFHQSNSTSDMPFSAPSEDCPF